MNKGAVELVGYSMIFCLIAWFYYASEHKDDKYISVINLTLIGITWLMLWGYVLLH